MLRVSKVVVFAPLFAGLVALASACERKVEPPPMVPEGTGKASASGVQPDIKPPAEVPPTTNEPVTKPKDPTTPATPKDSN